MPCGKRTFRDDTVTIPTATEPTLEVDFRVANENLDWRWTRAKLVREEQLFGI